MLLLIDILIVLYYKMHVSDLITASDIMASYSNLSSKVLEINEKQITNFSIAMPTNTICMLQS